MIEDALEDEEVEHVVLDIDSPGGEVSGVFELSNFIFNSRGIKNIFAICNDSACSAAYAIASSASKIFVNSTSSVGSIGVIATHVDVSNKDKKEGLKYTTVYAGNKKNDLSPHEPITDEALEDLQSEVNRLYGALVQLVARNRGLLPAHIKSMESAVYYGSDSKNIGLSDEEDDLRNCLAKLASQEETYDEVIEEDEEVTAELNELEDELEQESPHNQALKISRLCKLAHAEHRILEFLERRLTPHQVKARLMSNMSRGAEIRSTVYRKEKTKVNPLIVAAKARLKTKSTY